MVAERTWRMRLLQPYALGRASVVGRVFCEARQNGGMRCLNSNFLSLYHCGYILKCRDTCFL